MPETIVLEGGEEREVPTQEEMDSTKSSLEELEGLKTASETFGSLKTELGIEEGDDPMEKLKELKDSQNPNWAAMRVKLKAAEAQLKENGMSLDDKGNISKEGEKVNVEDVLAKAKEAGKQGYKEVLAGQMKSKMFDQFTDKAERESVETVFDRLMAVGGDFKENFELAVGQVFPERKNDIVAEAFNSGSGSGPIVKDTQKDFQESARGKKIADSLGLNKEEAKK